MTDIKKVTELKKEISDLNSFIKGLEPEIRLACFEVLKPYILGDIPNASSTEAAAVKSGGDVVQKGDVRDFFASFDPQKPADSTLVLAAWFYTQRGNTAFSLEEIYELFDEVGTPRPNKVNMTLKACSRKGKKLFMNAGHGKFRPNVNGENYFKSEMNLRPGKAD
jgi:hypothetical protein